jgi:hypothetical protein
MKFAAGLDKNKAAFATSLTFPNFYNGIIDLS